MAGVCTSQNLKSRIVLERSAYTYVAHCDLRGTCRAYVARSVPHGMFFVCTVRSYSSMLNVVLVVLRRSVHCTARTESL